jgi:hypothetical protein
MIGPIASWLPADDDSPASSAIARRSAVSTGGGTIVLSPASDSRVALSSVARNASGVVMARG